MTISASGGLELLQMVSELDIEWCASRDTGSEGGWIVRSHIGWRGQRNILYNGVETSSREAQRGQQLLAMGLECDNKTNEPICESSVYKLCF